MSCNVFPVMLWYYLMCCDSCNFKITEVMVTEGMKTLATKKMASSSEYGGLFCGTGKVTVTAVLDDIALLRHS